MTRKSDLKREKNYLYTVRILPERIEKQCKGRDLQEVAEKLKKALDKIEYVRKEKVR